MSKPCTFCRIAQHQMPAYIITEDEHVVAFLSKENHPLVVPKQHIPNIYSLDEPTGASIMKTAVQVSRALKVGLQCEGIYLTQANEPAAGQDVFHLHLHVYPRWADVDFRTQQSSDHISEDDKQEMLTKIIEGLKQN